MTNKKSPIEEKIAGLFRHQEASVPDDVWQKIESHLDARNRKRRRVIWIYFFMVGVLMILGSIAVFPLLRKSNTAVIGEKDTAMAHQSNSGENKQASIPQTERTYDGNASEGGVNNLPNSTTASPTAMSATRSINRVDLSPSHNSGMGNAQSLHGRRSISGQNVEGVDIVVKAENENRRDNSLGDNSHSSEKSRIETLLSNIASRDFEIFPSSLNPAVLPDALLFKDDEATVIKHDPRLRLFMDIDGGAGFPFRKITNHSVESDAYADRAITERPLLVKNFQAGIGILLDGNWTLRSGAEWQQLTEQFNYEKSDATRLSYTYDDLTGQVNDTSLVRGSLTEKFGNRYTMVNIPVYLGYEKRVGSWVLGLEGGAGFNLRFVTTGKILAGDQRVESLKDRRDIYSSTTGISWRAGVSCLRSVAPGTMIYARLMFMHYPESWTLSSHPNEIRYQFLTANVGLRKVI